MKAKRLRVVLNITMDRDIIKEMRSYCDARSLTYSGYIEDLVATDLKEKSK